MHGILKLQEMIQNGETQYDRLKSRSADTAASSV